MDTELKGVLDAISGSVAGFGTRIDSIQRQLDAVDIQTRGRVLPGGGEDLLKKAFEESGEFKRLLEMGKGRAMISVKDLSSLQTKTTITDTALGSGVSGVLMPERVGPIVPLPQRRLFMRDLLSRGNRVTANAAFFIEEIGFTNNASPQGVQGTAKSESAITFNTVGRPVQTLSHWIPASRQVLDDLPALLNYIRGKLLFGLRYKEDLQILSGDGTGGNLSGLIPAAAPFNTALLLHPTAGWNKIDILRRALQQVEMIDEVPSGFIVVNPVDWSETELTKDAFGRYIIGDPGGSDLGPDSLWSKPVVVTNAITAGTFLVGSSEGAELLDRMDATVEVSTEHADFFTRNLVAILCECREVLCIYRPNSFVYGSLNTSPLS